MIGVDWGTSQLRAYQIHENGAVVGSRSAPKGILSVPNGAFTDTLESVISDWLDLEPLPILMTGMIGSRQGWLEAPYVSCPATASNIARGLAEVSWGKARRGFICPGLTCLDPEAVPDVMRGEEVQVIGVLAAQGNHVTAICHPGTHSKRIAVSDGSIRGFTTYLTGELFAVLCEHSILGRTMTKGPVDWEAFDEGVARAKDAGGLLHHLFGARTRVLMGGLSSTREADYLSGILIGHEIMAKADDEPVVIVGAPELGERYIAPSAGLRARTPGAATASGLRLIWDLSIADRLQSGRRGETAPH